MRGAWSVRDNERIARAIVLSLALIVVAVGITMVFTGDPVEQSLPAQPNTTPDSGAGGLTAASAPWWFVAALTGLLGITGIVSGAVVGYRSVKASDERKHTFEREKIATEYKRDDDRRWDDRIQEVAARYVGSTYSAILAYENGQREIATLPTMSLPDQLEAMKTVEGMRQMTMSGAEAREAARRPARLAEAEASALLAELLMIAPDSVEHEAQKLWMYTTELIGTASDQTRKVSRKDYEIQRGRLIVVVKSVLRTPTGGATVVAVVATGSAEAKAPVVEEA